MLRNITRQVHIFLVAVLVLATALARHAEAQQHGEDNAAHDAVKDARGEAGHMSETNVVQHYRAEVNRLRDYLSGSIDPCRHAIYAAARDSQVASVLLRKLTNKEYVFKGVRCHDAPGIPEQRRVLFDFDCQPGTFCLIDPNVLVIVDVVQGKVVDIIDPYLGSDLAGDNHSSGHAVGHLKTDRTIAISTRGLSFVIGGAENPPIRVTRGETVQVTFTTGGSHDWTLAYVENGSEVVWAMAQPNSSVTFTADRSGEFEYFCSVGNHRERGMRGRFIVER